MFALTPRSDRVPLQIPIVFRRPPDDHWFRGQVVNLSETGVLFGPTELEPGTEVEVILSPPTQVGSLPAGKQVCTARVVRSTAGVLVAARFADCRFLLEAE